MTWLPWFAILIRHLVVLALIGLVAPEHIWRRRRAAFRRHWEARPWA
jgi:hypothetical protein